MTVSLHCWPPGPAPPRPTPPHFHPSSSFQFDNLADLVLDAGSEVNKQAIMSNIEQVRQSLGYVASLAKLTSPRSPKLITVLTAVYLLKQTQVPSPYFHHTLTTPASMQTLLAHPNGTFRLVWDLTTLGLLAFIGIFTPYQISFLSEIHNLDNIMEKWLGIFVIDRYVRAFVCAYVRIVCPCVCMCACVCVCA